MDDTTLPGVFTRTGGEATVDLLKLFPQGPGFPLQLSSRAEYGNPVILDLHRVAGLRVSGFSSLACLDLESPNTPKFDNPVLEKAALNLAEEKV